MLVALKMLRVGIYLILYYAAFMPQIRPLADTVHYKYILTYLLTYNVSISDQSRYWYIKSWQAQLNSTQ